MENNKIEKKYFIVLLLLLTLTAGYAQALPSIYDFRSQSSSTPSVQDFISSMLSRMYGNSQSWGISKPVPTDHKSIISEDEAIAIAKDHFRWPGFTKPVTAQLVGMEWIVTIHEYHGIEYRCREGRSCPPQPSGYIIRINAITGKIISVNIYV
jgi:hypothetical protein